jgi:hypothetical protein
VAALERSLSTPIRMRSETPTRFGLNEARWERSIGVLGLSRRPQARVARNVPQVLERACYPGCEPLAVTLLRFVIVISQAFPSRRLFPQMRDDYLRHSSVFLG